MCLFVMLTNSIFNNLFYNFKENLGQGELPAPSEISLSFLELGLWLKSCLLAFMGAQGSYCFSEVFLEYLSTHPGIMLLISLLITLSTLMISYSLSP